MQAHLKFAQKVFSDLKANGGRNTFGPGLPFIKLSEDKGEVLEAHTRCSSFVTNVLKISLGLTSQDFRRFFGRASPYAADYHEAIIREDLTEFQFIGGVQPGALLSIDYEGGFNNLGFTGHSAIVAATPKSAGEPLGKGTIWEVEVIDSCQSSHGPGDTRFKSMPNGETIDAGGIGKGKMQIVADADERILGYTWSVRGSSPLMLNGKGQTIRFAEFPASF